MSWQAVAERAARTRGQAVLAKVRAAIAEHAPNAHVELQGDEIRAQGRGLRHRWLSEPGLRFAGRISR